MVHLLLSLLFLFIHFLPPTIGQKFYDCRCFDNYTSGGLYQQNLAAALQNLTAQAALSGYFAGSYGGAQTKVYSGYFCRGDIDLALCHDCLGSATQMISHVCFDHLAGIIWYDMCLVGYSPVQFSSKFIPSYMVAISSNENVTVDFAGFGLLVNETLEKLEKAAAGFNRLVNETLEKVAEAAVADKTHQRRFATMEANFTGGLKVYTLAQCSPILDMEECGKCFKAGIAMLPGCCSGRDGGTLLLSSCVLRYEIFPFYGTSAETSLSGVQEGGMKKQPYVAGIIGGVGGLTVMLLFLAFWLIVYRTRRTRKTATQDANNMEEITTAESLQMDFNKVRAATQYFAADKKLGEGGFGDVYKGELENGQEIAVKRLTSNTGRGAAEFKNEVLLVAKLQHRNLVKLLGFCLSGEEKILVFEYLPHSSLDKLLFDPIKRASLNWETRFNIIYGIAKGLLYLHEDSRLRIIHRDLKSSNVLLDEAMNPKISDFGIARMFAMDQTRDRTNRIVGTYGYMAPEYVLTGQYSLKSDIYSFGIMVLEIVTGQRNKYVSSPMHEEPLLHRAWRLWNENEALNMVDSLLSNAYPVEEVVKCIYIGLLCIQEDPERRPKITSVVAALSGQSNDLPAPKPPNFLNIGDCTSSNSWTIATISMNSSFLRR